MIYSFLITFKKRFFVKQKNYLAVIITLLLILVLPLLLYGLNQIQTFTDHAGTIQLNFQPQLGSIQLNQTKVILNKPTVLRIIAPQKHGYDAIAIKIDTRYISNINLKDLQDFFLIKKIESTNSLVYLLSSKQFRKDLPKNEWLKELTLKNPTDSILSPTKCFLQYCTPDYQEQTVSLRLKRKVNLHYTLTKNITITQTPIQIVDYSLISNNEQAFYSFNTYRLKLNISQFEKNKVPIVTSEPPSWAIANKPLIYKLQILDADKDKTKVFLECPDFQVCTLPKNKNPSGLKVEGNQLKINFLKARSKPYHISTYITDGKATTKHSFDILVTKNLATNTPICEYFKTEYPIKTIAVGEITPLTLLAKDVQGIKKVVVKYINLSANTDTPESIQSWSWNPTLLKINLSQYNKQPLEYSFKNGEYKVIATITNQNDLTTECYLRQQKIQSSITKFNLAQKKENLKSRLNGQKNVSFLEKIGFSNILTPVQANNHGNTIITGINMPPTFTSDPYTDAVGNVILGTNYSYSLTVKDPDNDILQHIVVAKPVWANLKVVSNAGSLKLDITGIPNKIGGHTFSFSITDGYTSHYITQTWVVNVENAQNDLPRIIVTAPQGGQINQGDRLVVNWQASDRQQITNFNIYLTSNPMGTTDKQLILGGLKYNVRSANINTRHLPAGRFYVLVEGKDSFNPPATGFGVSEIINIIAVAKPTVTPVLPKPTNIKPDNPTPTPKKFDNKPTLKPDNPNKPVLQLPIATNLLPVSKAEITDTTPLISASLEASNNAVLIKKNINLLLDGQDITTKIKVLGDQKVKGALSYLPNADLNPGQHSLVLTIKDSKDKKNIIKWNFTLKEPDKKINDDTDNNASTEDTITFLGYTMPKPVAIFLGIGVLVVLIALILPLLLFMTWRKTEPTPKTLTGINPEQEPSYEGNFYTSFENKPSQEQVPGIMSTDNEMDEVYQQKPVGYATDTTNQVNQTNSPVYEKVSVDQFTNAPAPATEIVQKSSETIVSSNNTDEALFDNSLVENDFTNNTPATNLEQSSSESAFVDDNEPANVTVSVENTVVPPTVTNNDESVVASHVPDFMPPDEPEKLNYPSVNQPPS